MGNYHGYLWLISQKQTCITLYNCHSLASSFHQIPVTAVGHLDRGTALDTWRRFPGPQRNPDSEPCNPEHAETAGNILWMDKTYTPW